MTIGAARRDRRRRRRTRERAGLGDRRRYPRAGRRIARTPRIIRSMAYRSELEARVAKKTTKAIVDYEMIEDGDRVMVGLSGGKDSWALMQVLDVLRQRAPDQVLAHRGQRRFRLQGIQARTSSPARARRAAGSTASSTPISARPSTRFSRMAQHAVFALRAPPPGRAVSFGEENAARPRLLSAITPTTSSRRSCSTCSSLAS